MCAYTGSDVPDIFVTGHSLGGALATLFTTAWCSANPDLVTKV
jgi:putative lipase involved disintegration of autophagic bodies